ncbi:hypothetical protein BJV77DRAFT_968522 [Russula vinacea]|nr:hypothetical protein BJV77DRAFT_968522 [Russula vinacea]
MSSSTNSKVSSAELLKAQLVIAEAKKKLKEAKKDASALKGKGRKSNSKGLSTDANTQPSDLKPKNKASSVEWSKKENHPLTTKLLTLIEDDPMYKVAFGFDKGLVSAVPTGGFVFEMGWGRYQKTWLKRDYQKHRNSISETGQGLIDDDREWEIEQDSPLANI